MDEGNRNDVNTGTPSFVPMPTYFSGARQWFIDQVQDPKPIINPKGVPAKESNKRLKPFLENLKAKKKTLKKVHGQLSRGRKKKVNNTVEEVEEEEEEEAEEEDRAKKRKPVKKASAKVTEVSMMTRGRKRKENNDEVCAKNKRPFKKTAGKSK